MHLLIVTDEPQSFISLQEFLTENNHKVFFCGKQEDIPSYIKKKGIKLIVMELRQEELKNLTLLKEIKNLDPLLEVIIIGSAASSEEIGETIRLGAIEYVTKPFRIQSIESTLKRINKKALLRHETLQLEKELSEKYLFEGMVGKNPYMLEIFSLIERVAKYPINILITGETGTGKEMVTKAIHKLSPRFKKKLVSCDCAALPETLFESELFGYVKGAFTGADKTKRGIFEEAHEGTLFLDEIGNLPPLMQSKLLRVLEERQFRRLGSTENINLDIRLIAASSRDLRVSTKDTTFRIDLLHRLNTVEICLPALKDRSEDIPILARTFLDRYNKKLNKTIKGMSQRVQKTLSNYNWTGNIRELENTLEHSIAVCQKSFIDIEDMPKYLQEYSVLYKEGIPSHDMNLLSLDELENQHILKVMNATQGNIQQSAQILGRSRYTLYRKLKKINLSA